jgi:hypothetical protein
MTDQAIIEMLASMTEDQREAIHRQLKPVLDNVPNIAGALGVTAVAAHELFKHWDDLANTTLREPSK